MGCVASRTADGGDKEFPGQQSSTTTVPISVSSEGAARLAAHPSTDNPSDAAEIDVAARSAEASLPRAAPVSQDSTMGALSLWFKRPVFELECGPQGIHVPRLAALAGLNPNVLQLNGKMVDYDLNSGYLSLDNAFLQGLGDTSENAILVEGQPAGAVEAIHGSATADLVMAHQYAREHMLELLEQLGPMHVNEGAERMKLRLDRPPGADPSPVTEEEVLHIFQTRQEGPVEFIARLGAASDGPDNIRLAAILTDMAQSGRGGVVLIGVDATAASVQVIGCQPGDREFVQQVLSDDIQPALPACISTHTISGQSVIAIDIAPAQRLDGVGVSEADLRYYQRYGVKTVALAVAEAEAFIASYRILTPEMRMVPGATIQFSSRSRCFELGLVDDPECSIEQQKQSLQACGLLNHTSGLLTRAGLLLTGTANFQSKLPCASTYVIHAIYSSGCSSIAEALQQQQFTIKKTFEGPLVQMVSDAAAWVENLQLTPYKETLETIGDHTEYVGRSYRQYATEAIWQTLVNAVCHRDYDLDGQAIQLWMFPNSVQLRVPGGVMPNVGDLNQQPCGAVRNLDISVLLSRALQPHTRRRYPEGSESGVAIARRKQEQHGGSLTYEVEQGMVSVKIAAMLLPDWANPCYS